ncbi:MAG: hypothetical protein Q9225_002013 [Loekoesia sp. 1 TL-2023]
MENRCKYLDRFREWCHIRRNNLSHYFPKGKCQFVTKNAIALQQPTEAREVDRERLVPIKLAQLQEEASEVPLVPDPCLVRGEDALSVSARRKSDRSFAPDEQDIYGKCSSAMVNVSHGSAPVLTRPPTPPKENIEDSAKLPIGSTYQGTLGQHILLDTPEESPSSSSEYFDGPGGKLPKRVVFSPWTSYHKPLLPGGKTAMLEGKLRPLPPSKECIASNKSILKVSTNNSSPLFDVSQQLVLDPNETVAVMLRSVNQHLNSASRDSRLDSYRTLLGYLSAYEEVPGSQSLIENLTGFLEYIQRDIFAKQPASGNADVELASHALKVLSTVLYTEGLRDAVPHEFCTFIAEQAVSSIESQETPKVMLDHYMQLLARQKLPPKVINSEKANRILSALNGLEARVKGNRVVGLKLMIYQRLLVQAKSLMVPRAEGWLEFLICSMSSSIKDIRSRAIAFGTDAAIALGTTNAISQSCLDILDRDTPSGPKVVDCLGARMLELLHVKNEGFHVPQIWSVIVLFLRSRRRQIERWDHFKGWLGIMERAFNSSDAKVKLQANITWNKLVSVINLDTSTTASLIRVLRQPIASQLERKNSDNNLKHAKQLARSTYCNLLYYSFCPGVTHEQLDLFWDAFVAPILSIRPSMTKSDLDFSCEVLSALFSSSQPKVWDQNRAHQLSPMKPEELPCLDPKWIRFRVAKIICLLEDWLLHSSLAQSEDVQKTPFFKAWQGFVKAIGDAASKEVKVSMETMTAVAHIISSLSRYWNQKCKVPEAIPCQLDFFVCLIHETVVKVGFRPFAEKRLLQSSGNSFEATETPTSRMGRPRGSLSSPITFMLETVVNASYFSDPSGTYSKAIQTLLDIALRVTNGRRAHLTLLRQLAIDILPGRSGNAACRHFFWRCLAKETTQALSLPQAELRVDGSPQYPGNDYKDAIRLLELAIREFSTDTYSDWKMLSETVLDKIQDETCQEGIPLVYTEPLSKVIHEQGPETVSDDLLRCSTYVLDHTPWPQSRQALERAQKLLWGPRSVPRGGALLDPFDHLYSLIERLLTTTYSRLQSFSDDVVAALISGSKSFLLSCPLSLRAVCLKRMQLGLAVWIEDADVILLRDTAQGLGVLMTAIRELWRILTDSIKSVPKPDSSFLADIQDLLVAGFRSRHKAIVNDLIIMWNQSFAETEYLEYPAKLRDVLAHLRSRVDIGLPGFVNSEAMEITSSPFNFVESQDEEFGKGPRADSRKSTCSPDKEPTGLHSAYTPQHALVNKTRSPAAKPSPRESKSTPKGRLRHDNSQIQFAAIDSSPPTAATIESQHLTDHQKEVKERQEQGAAAMFPDIRSSPRRSRSAERPAELVLHKKQALAQPLDADADPSPTFPPGDTIMNEFLGSSPTPHSVRKSPHKHQFNQDLAPSPPDSPIPMIMGGNYSDLKATVPMSEPAENMEVSNPANAAPTLAQDLLKDVESPSNYQKDHGAAVDDRDGPLEHETAEGATHSMSNPDESVDAPVQTLVVEGCGAMIHHDMAKTAVPEVGSSANAIPEQPVTRRPTSNHKPEAIFIGHPIRDDDIDVADPAIPQAPATPTEDEQAREQLLRDLEEASSQGDSQVSKRRPSLSSPSEASKKRRTRPVRSTKPRKTTKRPASFLSCEVVVEKRKPDQENDNCIIVDDRPAAGKGKSTSPIIKQERSPSPAGNRQPSSPKTPVTRRNPTRRRTRSMTSRSSPQSSVAEDPIAPSDRSNRIRTRLDSHETDTTEPHPRKRRCTEQQQRADQSVEGYHPHVESSKLPGIGDDQLELPARMPSIEGRTVPTIAENDMTSSQMEGIKDLLLSTRDPALEPHEAGGHHPSSISSDGDTVPNTPHDNPQQAHDARPMQEAARSPGQKMLDRFKHLIEDVKRVTFWPQEGREMVELAFEVVRNVHDAERRTGRQVQ